MRTGSLAVMLLCVYSAVAAAASGPYKGEPIPSRTVELVVDIDNRFIEDEFAGDADAARTYVTNVLFAVRIILNQDLNITLSIKEIVVWENPAPFELDASEDPGFSDVFEAYRDYVWDSRTDSLPAMFQLFTGNVDSFGGLRTLALVSQPCNGVSALAAFANDTFPAGPGSVDVIFSARGLGRNLGAATNTTDPSVMATTINGSTPLLFLPESISAISSRLEVGDCWAPVVTEGESPAEICNDGIDNDENAFTDCDDFACAESPSCVEGEGDAQPEYQSADINLDFVINLSELLRVVQLYNSKGLHCGDANSEDGYVPGANVNLLDCAPHTSDFDPQDWNIILSELLQLIQLYNAEGYEPCEAPEAFCPVLP